MEFKLKPLWLVLFLAPHFTACGGGGGSNPPPAPVISSFVASASIVTAGEGATITPTFQSGSGSVDNGVGSVTSGSDITVSPTVDTTYTLTVTNSTGENVTRQLAIRVVAPPEISGFSSVDGTITNGQSTELTAMFANGDGQIDSGVGAVSSGVPESVSPSDSTVYTLSVTNEAGTTVAETLTVTVVEAPSITSFHLKGCTSLPNEDATLQPIFEFGTGVIDNGVGAVDSGAAIAVNPASDTTYTLTVTNSLGSSVSEQVSVGVNSAFLLVDTGEPTVTSPVTSGGSVVNINQSLAAEFSLDQPNMLTCIEGFVGGEIEGSASITIYDDGGEVPGTELFTKNVYLELGDAWQGLTGMDLSLPAGTYWVSFELRSLDDSFTGRMLAAPQPLLNHAYTTRGYPPLNLQGGSEWLEDDGLDLGVRIKFAQGAESTVRVGAKDWRQVTKTTGFTWSQVAAVCDEVTGICNGSIGSINFSGWIWASALEVGEMFSQLTPHPGNISLYAEAGSQWAPDFFQKFNPTEVRADRTFIRGLTRTTYNSPSGPPVQAYAGFVADLTNPSSTDVVTNVDNANLGFVYDATGIWLYKSASQTAIDWTQRGGLATFERQAITFDPVTVDSFVGLETNGVWYNGTNATNSSLTLQIYLRINGSWTLFAENPDVRGPFGSTFDFGGFNFLPIDLSGASISGINITNSGAGAGSYRNMEETVLRFVTPE